jgi:hypothetical protein
MISVYAIGDARRREAHPSVVECVREGDLIAFFAAGRPRDPDVRELRRHEAVVSSLMGDAGVLPMRFGSVMQDERELRALLRARRDEFARSLARVRGRVELGARALWREPALDALSGGGAFMRARLDRYRAARRVADEIHPLLAELAADSVCRVAPTDDAAFAGAYLVERTRVGGLKQRSARLRGELTNVDLVCTGPWPPYSFSGGGGA